MLNFVRRLREWREREKARREEERRRSDEVWQKWETEIKPLPVEEAKRRAELLLADPTHFRYEAGPTSEGERRKVGLLAPQLKEFFERYSYVRHVRNTGEFLDRALLCSQPVIMDDGKVSDQFLTIGWWGEEDSLVVKQGEEPIRIWGPGDEEEDYPSIYHLLLQLDLFSMELR